MEEPAVGTESAPPEESSNRLFIIAAAGLAGVFVIGLLCIGGYLLFFRGRSGNAAVQTQNAINAATNAAIIAAQTEAAKATSTPTVDAAATAAALTQAAVTDTPVIAATDTNTPVPPPPTDTPAATDTPVAVAQITDTPSPTGVSGAGGGGSPTPIGGAATNTPTPLGGAGAGTRTPTPLVGGLTPSPTALTQTGFAEDAGVWGLLFAGLGLIAVVVIIRRLRMSLR
jgi:hypothetical protein